MRAPRRTLAVTTLAIGLLFGVPASHAGCVAPSIALARRPDDRTIRVEAGQTIEVVGRYWTAECNDTSVGTSGCIWGGQPRREPPEPMRGIALELWPGMTPGTHDGLGQELASGIDADESLRFRTTVRLPADLDPGVYRIEARSGTYTTPDPLVLRVR